MDQKPTYEELENRIRILDSLVLNTPGMVYSGRPDWTTKIITQSEDVSGYSINEFNSGKINWLNIIHPADMDRIKNNSPQFTNEKKTISLEYRIIAKDGKTRWVLDKKTALFSEDNIYLGVAGVVVDITDRKKIEMQLKESEIKYKGVFDESIAAIYVFDTNKNFIDSNQAGLDLLGYSKKELLKMSIPDVDADPIVVLPAHKQLLGGDRIINYEHKLKRKDGKIITVLNNSRPLKDNKNHVIGMLSTLIDITERIKTKDALQKAHNSLEQRVKERTAELEDINEKLKKEGAERINAVEALRASEAKLARLKKMESLGLLAGGVAHDLNNILSGIVSYPELILLSLPEDSKLRNPIEAVHEAGLKAAATVSDLLTVARGVATQKDPLNLNDTIRDYLSSHEFKRVEQINPPSVTVNTDLDTGLLNITGSQIHIRKIIMNLITNAMEAIKDSGTINISTFNQYIDKPLKRYDDINIGEYAVLSVSDDGSGISSGNLERIFEPFYTKKVLGRSGTGLGLAVVWNSVQDHNGYIDVKSNENGTTFQLYFPITRDEISESLSVPIKDYKGNGEKILVVDDEENQRKISCNMLDVLGYNAFAVSSGEKALDYLNTHSADLLLLDMIMGPGINGRETYERVIKYHPNQKAIIVSGFAETTEVQKTQKLGAGKYIKKPLTIEKLGIAVKEELEK